LNTFPKNIRILQMFYNSLPKHSRSSHYFVLTKQVFLPSFVVKLDKSPVFDYDITVDEIYL